MGKDRQICECCQGLDKHSGKEGSLLCTPRLLWNREEMTDERKTKMEKTYGNVEDEVGKGNYEKQVWSQSGRSGGMGQ